MSVPLKIERTNGTWTFTLNRPEKRNALSAELVDALLAGVDEAHRGGVALLVFRGEGKNFSAGFDFGDFDTQSEGDLLLRFVRIESLLHKVARSPSLTVALVHGRNFGAGVDLIASCRQRVAVPDTTFRMPGLKFGLVLGSRRFADLIGPARAAAILQEARTFDAVEAQAIGFVDALVDAADWPATLDAVRKTSNTLDAETRASLYGALSTDHGDADLAALVRSAARPGLKERIRHYLAAS